VGAGAKPLNFFGAGGAVVFPLYDDNPFKHVKMPYATWGLIALNFVLFLGMLATPDAEQSRVVLGYAVVPAQLTSSFTDFTIGWSDATLLTGLFLHAGWAHLLGNMVYLWVFGDDIEEALGRLRFLAFYLLAGIAATLVYVAFNAQSTVPLVGASGAVSGVLAAYMMLRPCAKVTVFILRIVVRVRAYWVIGAWALLQVLGLRGDSQEGIAYIAHFGGLAAGAILFLAMRPPGVTLFECVDHLHKVSLTRRRLKQRAMRATQHKR